jgi:hypothetical protein
MSPVGIAGFMRLSLMKAAHAVANEVVTKLSCGDETVTRRLSLTFSELRLRVQLMRLSGVMKRFGQFGCAKDVCDALQVICHRREADFDPCTGQPAHQQTRMSEDTVLDRREGMLDGGST